MSDRPSLDFKWTIIGAAVIVALNQVLSLALASSLLPSLIEGMGEMGGLVVFAILVALGSFFVGGLLVGWLSPGETLAEPAVACVVAVVVNGLLAGLSGAQNLVGLVLAAAIGFGLGLLGAKVGERIQGDTTEKMRERGEL